MGLGAATAMPDLGQQRTLSSRPGSGLVRSSGRPKPRRDRPRQHAANVKREWKNAKRRRHLMACFKWNHCAKGSPFAVTGVSHGQ